MTSRLEFTHGGHRYTLDGRPVKSVTTLLAVLAKPALVAWAANSAADYAIDMWDDLALKTPSERRALIAGAHRRKKDRAAARGTQIHAWADALINGQPVEVPDEHLTVVMAFADWWQASGFVAVHAEAAVYAEEDDLLGCAYAGRFDMLAEHPRYGVTLIDWKTGRGVYSEYAVQVAAYAAADMIQVEDPDHVGPVDQAMPHCDTLAVAHIQPDGTTLHVLDRQQQQLAYERWETVRALNTYPEPEWSQQ